MDSTPASHHHEDLAVVLVGHGAPATDCPPELVGELMGLEFRAGGHHAAGGHQPSDTPANPPVRARAAELDAQIRDWPRRANNDPYKVGIEQLADVLRPMLPTERFVVAYNEFCRPSIAEAMQQVILAGANRVIVIPSMMTPGGVHSEHDIPHALGKLRKENPGVLIEYVWPFDLKQVARLLASHINRAMTT